MSEWRHVCAESQRTRRLCLRVYWHRGDRQQVPNKYVRDCCFFFRHQSNMRPTLSISGKPTTSSGPLLAVV